MITSINIKGISYPFKYGYGALMLAEEILGKPWGELQNSRVNFVLLFCCFLNASSDFPYSFDDLIDLCDEDAELVGNMGAALSEQLARWGKPKEEGDDKKKG